MKKKKAKPAKAARRFPRPSVMIIAAIAVVAIAAITVVSRQSSSSSETKAPQKATTATADKKYMTVKVAGQEVQIDSQTGKMKPLTPEEARKLAEGLKGMLNKSAQGLVQEQNADGSVSVDLQGRFQSVTVARENQDGTLTQSCVDSPRAAAAFFGIDPKLLEPEKPTNQPQ